MGLGLPTAAWHGLCNASTRTRVYTGLMTDHQTLIAALTEAWEAVAPTAYRANIHVLTQREIALPDGMGAGIAYPALVYYATLTDQRPDSPDGRRAQTTTQFALDFRAEDYSEAWDLAEAFGEHLADRKDRYGVSAWSYAPDDYGVDLATASKLVPRKVALLEFRK